MSQTNPEYRSSVDQALLNLLRVAAGIGPLLILTHDSPDPDALASGKGLAYLFKEAWNISSELVYSGLVARAENRMVLNLLTPEWRHAEDLPDIDQYSCIILVDTQPGAGNNRLPANITPQIVIDHHRPLWDTVQAVRFVDIRPELGATVSLVYQYLEAAQLVPDATLATAMFYGLQTDTRGLARDASHTDEAVYIKLVGSIDRQKLSMVEQAGLSRDYFKAFNRGLEAARVYGKCVFANLGAVHRPDLPAEMADVLIRLESARAAMCLGVYGDQMHLSLRTEPSGQDAGQLMQEIIGKLGKAGGHGSIAGGQISLTDKDADQLAEKIEIRFLSTMREDEKGRSLL